MLYPAPSTLRENKNRGWDSMASQWVAELGARSVFGWSHRTNVAKAVIMVAKLGNQDFKHEKTTPGAESEMAKSLWDRKGEHDGTLGC